MFEYPEFFSPVALSILDFDIRWYSLSYISGFLYFYWFSEKNKKIFNLNQEKLDSLFFYSFIGVIVGGRIGYVLFYNIEYFYLNPLSVFKIWQGGMSFHGALIGCVITIFLFTKKNNIAFFSITDLFSLTAPLGIALGRIANLLNKELVGRETNFLLSIKYPGEDGYRHLSQIYESLLEGVIPFIILNIIYFNYKAKIGLVTGIFLTIYGASRISIEFIREPDTQIGFLFNHFTIAQILSVPIFTIGLLILFYVSRSSNK